jgi:hypothetical protein
MTIHEMLQQVALLSSGTYRREGGVSQIEIRLPHGRRQVIFGKTEKMRGEAVGLLYTRVGALDGSIDLKKLIEYNAMLRYSKISILDGDAVVLLVMFDLIHTSVKECAPMLQEMAAIADELERIYFNTDVS